MPFGAFAQMLNVTASSSCGSSDSASALASANIIVWSKRGAGGVADSLDGVEVALDRLRRDQLARHDHQQLFRRSGGTSWLGASARAATRPHASNRCVEPGRRADAYHAQ